MPLQDLAAEIGEFDPLTGVPDAHRAAMLLPRAPVLPSALPIIAPLGALERHGADEVPGIVGADYHQQQEQRGDNERA